MEQPEKDRMVGILREINSLVAAINYKSNIETALQASVDKWTLVDEVISTLGRLIDAKNCPLCVYHLKGVGCGECPVMMDTNMRSCEQTPYYPARNAFWALETAVSDEKEYLRSLLPGEF